MSTLVLSLDGNSVIRGVGHDALGTALSDLTVREGDRMRTGPVLEALSDWAGRYRRAVVAKAERPAFQLIGSEMLDWLDQGGALASWLAGKPRDLEIRVDPLQSGPLAEALLTAPWEILGRKSVFLAEEAGSLVVARRCGGSETPDKPEHRDLSLMFMAAAPEGDDTLDFEREEAAILAATQARGDRPPLAHLQVEESGALAFLDERLTYDGPFEALHLSCHGTIAGAKDGGAPQPILLFETAEGGRDAVDPERLMDEIRDVPPLVFLSACRTAERGDGKGLPPREGHRGHALPGFGEAPQTFAPETAPGEDLSLPMTRRDPGSSADAAPDLADPYVRQLARQVPNVLGWDGSVHDTDATAFAEAFYGALSRGDTVPLAAARARQAVLRLNATDPNLGLHWHLARVYLGPRGGGRICDPRKPARDRPASGETVFLDAEAKIVEVAGPSEFVGRRRAIQAVIRAYREGARGVVVHGMGNLGKSSLAARVAGRLRRHKTVAVFGSATARTIFAALARAGRQIAAGLATSERKALLEDLKDMEKDIAGDVSAFGDITQSLFTQIFNAHPVLLVLDDFEQSLARPAAGETVVPSGDHARAIAALLRALSEADTQSRLLITSRYDFTVPDGAGNDLARPLARVPLAPMGTREQVKQIRAKARAGQTEETLAATPDLMQAALAEAGGNPGLQDVLTKPILAGEADQARAAIAIIAAFKADPTRVPPSGDDIGDFFQRMAFETYSGALTGTEALVLGAATLFQEALPVPRAALAAVVAARGVTAPDPAISRLLALGLLDDYGPMRGWPEMDTVPHLAANPLARPLGRGIPEDEIPALAAAALTALARAWKDREHDFPRDSRGVEAARLALVAEPLDPAHLDSAAQAAVIFLYKIAHDARAALAIGQAALARLENLGHSPGPVLLGTLVNAAERLGETDLQERLIDLALALNDLTDDQRGQFLGQRATREAVRGEVSAANSTLEETIKIFTRSGDKQMIAFTWGSIADILHFRGSLSEARRIRVREELPVYEDLGDALSIANTMRKLANISFVEGDIAEARRILEEQCLPAFEALGDRRGIALARGDIAKILLLQGHISEARRIREEQELPAYDALGDRRAAAMTRAEIADILQLQGELEEAKRIYQEECLPIFRTHSDMRSIAVTCGKVADIFQAQGNLAEARRVREEECFPAYKEVGDRHGIAFTRGRIADILQAQGDLTEARRIREEEELPAYKSLGDMRSIANTHGAIADILQAQGDLAEARRIREEECLPAYEALGDGRSIAVTRGKIADILQAQGDLAEARRICEEECLPAYKELGDKREIAVTRGKIANILQAQGDLAEARRILEEECLPTYEDLGDKRSTAVTRGKIAEMMMADGDLDGALEMHLARLPIAQEMRDLESLAHIRFCCAQIRLVRGDHQRGKIHKILDELDEAFGAALKIQRPDSIGAIGALLGQVLAMGGHKDKAVEVLQVAAAAYGKIGQQAGVQYCEDLIRKIRGSDK